MAKTPDRPARPADVEPDPRTDGVEDHGRHELAPPAPAEIHAGVEHDRGQARAIIADPDTPYAADPGDDQT